MGLDKTASQDDVKKKYRELARKFHPDVNPNDQDSAIKFKEISAAFEVLNDPQSRREYDTFGTVRTGSPFAQGRPFTSPFEDMFNQFFKEQRRHVRKGDNITVQVVVDLKQILTGDEIEVKFKRRDLCKKCTGSGGTTQTCSHCEGSGKKFIQGRLMTVQAVCHFCSGTGKVIDKNCPECDGGYTSSHDEKINFSLYPGTENGMRFVQHGLGEPSVHSDGVPGDLFMVVVVKKDEFFERQDEGNLFINWPLSYKEIIFGTEIEVPTIEGSKVFVKVPAGTQPGKKIRLKNLGLPIFNPGGNIYQRGDQYINIILNIPNDLDDQYKDIVDKLNFLESEKLNVIRKINLEKIGEKYGKSKE